MSNINNSASFAKRYSDLTTYEKNMLSDEELNYLRNKEDRENRKDAREAMSNARANLNSGVNVLREGRSWWRFLSG